MNGKVCLVTGASSGIGRETTAELVKQGARVVMVCRDRARADDAVAEVKKKGNPPVVILGDLASQRDVRRIAEELSKTHDRLDVLIHNAGAVNLARKVTPDGLEQTFAVNHLAPFLLTHLLLPLIEKSEPARILVVASQVEKKGKIDWDDLQGEEKYDPLTAYFQSKLANVLFTYALARKLEGKRITVNCLHPGVIATNLLANYLGKTSLGLRDRLGNPGPASAAKHIARLALDAEYANISGGYFYEGRRADSSSMSHDRALQDRLWEVSAKLTSSEH